MMHAVYCPHPMRPAADREVLPVALQAGDTLGSVVRRLGLAETPLVAELNGRAVHVDDWAGQAVHASDVLVLQQDVAGAEIGAMVASWASQKFTTLTLAQVAMVATVTTYAANFVLAMALSAIAGSLSRKKGSGALDDSPTAYSIQGGSNTVRQFEPLPLVLGEHRMFPDYASAPFTEFVPDPTTATEVINNTPTFEERVHAPFVIPEGEIVPGPPWTLLTTEVNTQYWGDNQARSFTAPNGFGSSSGPVTRPHTFVVRALVGVPSTAELATYEDYLADMTPPSPGGGGESP